MRVSVRQTGGAFGIDKTVEVTDGRLRIVEDGDARDEGELDSSDRGALERLASTVRSASVSPASGTVYDAMITEIEIGEGSDVSTLTVRSGDDAPSDVWDLVNLVLRSGARDRPEDS